MSGEGQGVRYAYGPPSNTESEGWEVVEQEDKTAAKNVSLLSAPSPARLPLSINPNAEVSTRTSLFRSRDSSTRNAVPSHVVDELLSEQRMTQQYTSKLDEINLFEDNEDTAAWGTDSPSNLLGSDDLDYEDNSQVDSPPVVPNPAPSTPVNTIWAQNSEFSPRSPPPGAFGDDDLDLDDDIDIEPPSAEKIDSNIGPIVDETAPSAFIITSPMSQASEPPAGAFGDDDLDLDDECESTIQYIDSQLPDEDSTSPEATITLIEDLHPENGHYNATDLTPHELVPELHLATSSYHESPTGVFGDDDLDLDDEETLPLEPDSPYDDAPELHLNPPSSHESLQGVSGAEGSDPNVMEEASVEVLPTSHFQSEVADITPEYHSTQPIVPDSSLVEEVHEWTEDNTIDTSHLGIAAPEESPRSHESFNSNEPFQGAPESHAEFSFPESVVLNDSTTYSNALGSQDHSLNEPEYSDGHNINTEDIAPEEHEESRSRITSGDNTPIDPELHSHIASPDEYGDAHNPVESYIVEGQTTETELQYETTPSPPATGNFSQDSDYHESSPIDNFPQSSHHSAIAEDYNTADQQLDIQYAPTIISEESWNDSSVESYLHQDPPALEEVSDDPFSGPSPFSLKDVNPEQHIEAHPYQQHPPNAPTEHKIAHESQVFQDGDVFGAEYVNDTNYVNEQHEESRIYYKESTSHDIPTRSDTVIFEDVATSQNVQTEVETDLNQGTSGPFDQLPTSNEAFTSPFDSTGCSADTLFTSDPSDNSTSMPDFHSTASPFYDDSHGQTHHAADASDLFSSSATQYGNAFGGEFGNPPADSANFFTNPSNYHSAPSSSHADNFFTSDPGYGTNQFHSVDHAADLFSQPVHTGSPFDDPFTNHSTYNHDVQHPFSHTHEPGTLSHHSTTMVNEPETTLSHEVYEKFDNGIVHHPGPGYNESSYYPEGGHINDQSALAQSHVASGSGHSEFDQAYPEYGHHHSSNDQHDPFSGSNASPFDSGAPYHSEPASMFSHPADSTPDQNYHYSEPTATISSIDDESRTIAESHFEPQVQEVSSTNTTTTTLEGIDSVKFQLNDASSSTPSPVEEAQNPHVFSQEQHVPLYEETNHYNPDSISSIVSQVDTALDYFVSTNSPPKRDDIVESPSFDSSTTPKDLVGKSSPIPAIKPKIELTSDHVPTADSLFSPTNGSEISNVFGGNAFDQPPSSLGGFPPSSSTGSSLFFRQGTDSHQSVFGASVTGTAPGADQGSSDAIFKEVEASSPFGDTPEDDPFNQSASELFRDSLNDPFSQHSHQQNDQYAYNHQMQHGYDQSVNPASGYVYEQASNYSQSAHSHDYNQEYNTGYAQQSYEAAASVASTHFESKSSQQYSQSGYHHETQPTLNRATSSASSHFNDPAPVYQQAANPGYQQSSQIGTQQYATHAYNHPTYNQPIAQTFDQPAPPSHLQSPGQGFPAPSYQRQQYGGYNNTTYGHHPPAAEGYEQQSYHTANTYNPTPEQKPKPTIFKPQATPSQAPSYEQHAPRMSRELKQQYNPTPVSTPQPTVFNPNTKINTEQRTRDPSVVPRSCLATFGFGGNVCVMFPRRKLKLLHTAPRNSPRNFTGSQSFEEHIDESRKGPLDFYKLDQLRHPDDEFYKKIQSYPGPVSNQVSDDALLKYMAAQVSTSVHEDERLLWELMQVFLKSKGTVSSRDAQVPDILLTQLIQNSIARRANLTPFQVLPPAPAPHESVVEANTVKIRQLLLDGDRKTAIESAMAANMWPQALLMASYVDTELYKTVVQAFVTSRYGVGDPLRTMLMVFGDLEVKSLHEPQPLLGAGRAPAESPLVGNWLTQVQMLVANPTKDTNRVLVELGDRVMRETNNVWAAHVCYLLSGVVIEAPSATARMSLIGGNATGDVRFFVRPNTIQWTEVYEHVMQQTPLVPFQGYKFIYATLLADAGCCDLAFKYVDSMRKFLEQWTTKQKMQSPYLDNLKMQLNVFDDRLRYYMGQDKVEAAEIQANKRGILGAFAGFLDKTIDKMVNDSPPPVKTVAPPSSGSEFSPHMFPPAPGSSNSSQPPLSQNTYGPGSQSNSAFNVQPPGSQGNANMNPGFQHPPNSNSSNLNALPPRPQSTAALHAPQAPHPQLKKSSSFVMERKEKLKEETSSESAPSSEKSKAKTPPTSSQKKTGGWFPSISLPSIGLVDMIRDRVNPVGDAKVAKLGNEKMEAYYCPDKKRWIFPGEEAVEEAGPPPPPPTSFPTPSAPASSTASSNENDPLAALMAPPPMKETTPLAAMMAPPPRSLYGSQKGSSGKKAPPRPQFAVFKPNPAAVTAPSVEESSQDESTSSLPPPTDSKELTS